MKFYFRSWFSLLFNTSVLKSPPEEYVAFLLLLNDLLLILQQALWNLSERIGLAKARGLSKEGNLSQHLPQPFGSVPSFFILEKKLGLELMYCYLRSFFNIFFFPFSFDPLSLGLSTCISIGFCRLFVKHS